MSVKTAGTRTRHTPAYLRLMVEHAPAGQGIATLDGVIVETNPALCALFGRPREQVVGHAFWEFVHPDDQQVSGGSMARLLAGGTGRDIHEVRLVRGDGVAVDAQVMVTLLRSAPGRPALLIAVITDISARRRAEAEMARRVAEQQALATFGQFALGATAPAEVVAEAIRAATEVLKAGGAGFYPAGSGESAAGFVPSSWMRSSICVPVSGAGGSYGEFAAQSPEPGHFVADDEIFLRAVANVLAGYLDRHEGEARARYASLHDQLTGLPTRHLFLERVAVALEGAAASGRSVGVLLVDVDRLKLVNDSLGREIGDQLLAQTAARLRATLREGDLLARVGGDEFAVLCPGLHSAEAALALGDRLRAALAPMFLLDGRTVFATASIGVAFGSSGGARDLLGRADTAVHLAKSAGCDRVELFHTRMQDEAAERLQLGADLHDALERHEFRLFYQPILRLRDGAVVGAEALIRWQHPGRGLVNPIDFIAVAEDSGLIVPIGAWVIEEACRAAARWPAGPGGQPLKVSVNVSARQLSEPGFRAMVARAIDASGLQPGALSLELTESLLMTDAERSQAVLSSLKEMGLCLSVDDFGTGYSSLARLKRFPVDYLKIDRSFVDGLGNDSDDEAIVASIIGLAHAMGLAVVAEGVETDEQCRRLRALHCEGGQGWLWSKAVPEVDFLAWLETHPQPETTNTSDRTRPGRRRSGPARVLVVDDDPDQIGLVEILLRAGGFEVIPVLRPSQFADVLRRVDPDLVLMDLRMPGGGGLELVEDVAERGIELPPIVAVTGHADWLTRPLAGTDRFAGVIAKPIDPEAFVAQVEAFLAGAASAG